MKEKFINDKNVKCYTYNQFIKKIAQYSESTNLMNISDIKTSSFEDSLYNDLNSKSESSSNS